MDERLRAQWAAGKPIRDIARSLRVTHSDILERASAIRLTRPSMKGRKPVGRPPLDGERTHASGFALRAGHPITTSCIGMTPWA